MTKVTPVIRAILVNTGQNQATLTVILIVGAVLVALGLAAMIAVRVSRKKNSSATTYRPSAPDTKSETTSDVKPASPASPAESGKSTKPAKPSGDTK